MFGEKFILEDECAQGLIGDKQRFEIASRRNKQIFLKLSDKRWFIKQKSVRYCRLLLKMLVTSKAVKTKSDKRFSCIQILIYNLKYFCWRVNS